MEIKYDMLEPLPDLNASLEMLTSTFAPIYTEAWVKDTAAAYGNPPFDMNVNVFAQMWFSKAMRIFMAYEDGVPVGYLLGMTFRPLTHRTAVFQIESWYAKDRRQDVINGLFDYMQTAVRFIGIDELWIAHNQHETVPPLQAFWHKRDTSVIDRYVK